MEAQNRQTDKKQTRPSNPKDIGQCWKHPDAWSQTTLQSHPNQNNMVLAQNQMCGPMGLRDKAQLHAVTVIQFSNQVTKSI